MVAFCATLLGNGRTPSSGRAAREHSRSNMDDPLAGNGVTAPRSEICQLVLEQIADTAVIFVDVDGAIRGWNGGAQTLFRYGQAENLGLHLSHPYTEPEPASRPVPTAL